MLLALSGLGILGNFAHAVSKHAEGSRHDNSFAADTSMRVGECIGEIAYIGRLFKSQPDNDCTNPADVYELAAKGGPVASCPDGKREGSGYDRFTDES
ncbi:MAG TPA: hypothetical protein VG327_04685, partial [Mycobacterium sp.]|nr:hypothetical protein [Mycobacterium sp.]